MSRRVVALGACAIVSFNAAAVAAPYAPLIGSPNSLQHTAIATALDLNEFEPEGSLEIEDDSDFIGVGVSYWNAGRDEAGPGGTVDAELDGTKYDIRYQKALRPFEGSRARVLIDTPLTIVHANRMANEAKGGPSRTALMGTLSLGVEVPVQPNWLVTPRVAYGVTGASNYYGGDAELFTASLTSRYKLPQVGRGDLTIGNMLSYSKGLNTFIADPESYYVDVDTWTLRNGLAYQLPLKQRMFGRQSSLRASYTYTFLFGHDEHSYDQVHELALSVGVRSREAEQKGRVDQMRIGAIYTHAVNQFNSRLYPSNFDAVQLIFGYRF